MPYGGAYTAQVLRNIITTSISHSAWETESGASILRLLRESGLGIREQDFYAIRREILDLQRYEEAVRGLRPDTRVPVAWIDPSPGWKLSENFLYQAVVYGYDPITHEYVEHKWACGSEQQLFKETAESQIYNSIITDEEHYGIVPISVELFHVYHKTGYRFAP